MTWSVKVLLHKHKNLSSDPQNPRKWDGATWICNPNTGERQGEMEGPLVFFGPLVHVTSKFQVQ